MLTLKSPTQKKSLIRIKSADFFSGQPDAADQEEKLESEHKPAIS